MPSIRGHDGFQVQSSFQVDSRFQGLQQPPLAGFWKGIGREGRSSREKQEDHRIRVAMDVSMLSVNA